MDEQTLGFLLEALRNYQYAMSLLKQYRKHIEWQEGEANVDWFYKNAEMIDIDNLIKAIKEETSE